MKLYCQKCQKVFPVDAGTEPNSNIVCPVCNEPHTVPESHTSPGVVIGDFLIESRLSSGGMGDVFVARQISLDREVALKILQDKFTGDKEYIDGLFYEARAAAKVNHPNVVQAYAVGEEDGIYYFAMELIRGETFKQIIQREKVIDQERALKVIKEIASALDAAWREQKLVHQDIKPDNIMLDANGFAKLADLGLARKAGVNDEHAEAGDEVMGTPQYISPEQLTGVPTDVRSDIYSLGATFFQMVTGRFAYVAETVEEMSQKHVDGNLEPPQSVNPQISDEVNAIIMKMMARNIEERYQEPQELIKDIDNALLNAGRKSAKTPPTLKLKLKTPGAAAPRKAAAPTPAPAKPQLAAPKKAAVPPSPAKSVPPQPVKSAPPQPVKPVSPAPSPVQEVKVETPEVKPVNEAKPEEKKEEKKPETPADQQSVRSALLAKHQEDKGDESESEEMEAIIAETKPGRGKKIAKITAISIGSLLIVALALAITLLICAEQSWMPGFARPIALQLRVEAKKLLKAAVPEKKTTPQVAVPEKKKVIVTRSEYLAKVDALLTDFRNNPNAKAEWFKKANASIEYILSPVTEEERRASKPLLNIYHRMDEQLVFAPYREKEESKRLAAINKAKEAERLAREAEEKKLRDEEQKRKEYELRLEAERKQAEQERKARLAGLEKDVKSRITPLIQGAVEYFRGGSDAKYQAAYQECLAFTPPYAETNDEQKLVDLYKNSVKNTRSAVDGFRKFLTKVKDLSAAGIMSRLTIGGKSRMVAINGIDPDGTLHYKPLNDKPGKVDISEQKNFAFANQIQRVIKDKNTKFYLMLLAGKNKKELEKNTQDKVWKSLLATFPQSF